MKSFLFILLGVFVLNSNSVCFANGIVKDHGSLTISKDVIQKLSGKTFGDLLSQYSAAAPAETKAKVNQFLAKTGKEYSNTKVSTGFDLLFYMFLTNLESSFYQYANLRAVYDGSRKKIRGEKIKLFNAKCMSKTSAADT